MGKQMDISGEIENCTSVSRQLCGDYRQTVVVLQRKQVMKRVKRGNKKWVLDRALTTSLAHLTHVASRFEVWMVTLTHLVLYRVLFI